MSIITSLQLFIKIWKKFKTRPFVYFFELEWLCFNLMREGPQCRERIFLNLRQTSEYKHDIEQSINNVVYHR
jgi:hypothetical protein